MRTKAPAARLFVDETYREATYGDELPPQSAAALDVAIITGGSVSKAHGAPGLRVGWLTVRDPKLRERLTVAKMNLVISGSPLDETLAATVLDHREAILRQRRTLLATGLSTVAAWVGNQAGMVQWVKPDGGALCCLRLNPTAFDATAINPLLVGASEVRSPDRRWVVVRRVIRSLATRLWLSSNRRSSDRPRCAFCDNPGNCAEGPIA